MTEEKKEQGKDEKKPSSESSKENKKVEVPKKFKSLVEEIEKLSVLDLSELVKVLENKFGVSASAPVAVAAAAGAGGAQEGEGKEAEKTEFNVVITGVGDSRIGVIKAIRDITGKGLKEAKDAIEKVPATILEKADKAKADETKKKLEEAGATVELK